MWSEATIITTKELKENISGLIKNAYEKVYGTINPEEIVNDDKINFWKILYKENKVIAVIFGKRNIYGIKITGVGHDGSLSAVLSCIKEFNNLLLYNGYYAELSEKMFKLFNNLNIVKKQSLVRQILNKKLVWQGAGGWYIRDIDGYKQIKIMVGRPIV